MGLYIWCKSCIPCIARGRSESLLPAACSCPDMTGALQRRQYVACLGELWRMPYKLMCLGKLKATHWALWPRCSGHYPLILPNKAWARALAAMDSCFGPVRPHQHYIAYTLAQEPTSCVPAVNVRCRLAFKLVSFVIWGSFVPQFK